MNATGTEWLCWIQWMDGNCVYASHCQSELLHVANKFRRLGKDYLTSSVPSQISLAKERIQQIVSKFGGFSLSFESLCSSVCAHQSVFWVLDEWSVCSPVKLAIECRSCACRLAKVKKNSSRTGFSQLISIELRKFTGKAIVDKLSVIMPMWWWPCGINGACDEI